ncbi:hypothetical protein FI667_g10504, partial [Globisporangium splendens]
MPLQQTTEALGMDATGGGDKSTVNRVSSNGAAISSETSALQFKRIPRPQVRYIADGDGRNSPSFQDVLVSLPAAASHAPQIRSDKSCPVLTTFRESERSRKLHARWTAQHQLQKESGNSNTRSPAPTRPRQVNGDERKESPNARETDVDGTNHANQGLRTELPRLSSTTLLRKRSYSGASTPSEDERRQVAPWHQSQVGPQGPPASTKASLLTRDARKLRDALSANGQDAASDQSSNHESDTEDDASVAPRQRSSDIRSQATASCIVTWCTREGKRHGLCWSHGGGAKEVLPARMRSARDDDWRILRVSRTHERPAQRLRGKLKAKLEKNPRAFAHKRHHEHARNGVEDGVRCQWV